jgi:hydroxymethylbilane synthase
MLVAHELERAHADRFLRVELKIFKTTGDQIADRPLHEVGGKGLFTKELELALLAGEIDFAVHSFKDVPVTMPLVDQTELVIAAVPTREDPRDVLVSRKARRIQEVPQGSRVGTGSLRRRAQVLRLRPDLQVESIRGNIDTRLRKTTDGQYDAVILALAGLKRTELFAPATMQAIEIDDLLPAPGQGALALQCRADNERARRYLSALNDESTATCVAAERKLVQSLHGDCHSPIAALATIEAGMLHLRASVGARDGKPPVVDAYGRAAIGDVESAVAKVFQSLIQQNAPALLAGDI